ncbi:MAG: hypothetical protein P4M11_06690 [Candidatus Pacebacteria bacterium]|nr:hypothetical protein [Candidatus Paceibacterota bacterium]
MNKSFPGPTNMAANMAANMATEDAHRNITDRIQNASVRRCVEGKHAGCILGLI